MVVKRYAVILNDTDVENIILLDDSLERTWFDDANSNPDDDSHRVLVEDTGQTNIRPGATYDESRPIAERFKYVKPAPRIIDLSIEKIRAGTATLQDVVKYLELRDHL